MKRLFQFSLRHGKSMLAVFLLITAFAGIGITRLKIDNSTDSFSPGDNPIIKKARQVESKYNTGESVIGILHSDDIFTAANFSKLKKISDDIKAMDGVIQVVSLATTHRMAEVDGELVSSDLIPDDPGTLTSADMAQIKQYLATNYAMKDGILASKDGKSTTVIVRIQRGLNENKMSETIEAAIKRDWAGSYDYSGGVVLGREIFSYIQGVPLIALISLAVILLFLAINFRSPLGVFLPFVQILIGLVWGLGFIGWAGFSFLALMAISPIAIMAVGSSFSLHLLGRYYLELSRGSDKRKAIESMSGETGIGVFVSGLAISVSMLTFLLSELEMIRSMGLFTAVGVFASMLAALFLLPAVLNMLPAPVVKAERFHEGGFGRSLRKLGKAVSARPRTVLVIGLALVLASTVGFFHIVPDASVIAYFPKDSQAIRGLHAVESSFGGATAVNIVVDGDLKDPKVLAAMLKFQEDVHRIPGTGPAQSIATVIRTLHETLTGEAGLPSSENLVSQELLVYQSSSNVDDLSSMTNLDYSEGLISLVVRMDSSSQTKATLAQVDTLLGQDLRPVAKAEVMGDVLVQSILEGIVFRDFIVSLTLALILVVLIDSMIRSFPAALVTILVLLFTIALQYGVIGLLGIKFTMATALMGALAIGVGDYAIHLTVRYMEDRRKGLPPEEAIQMAIITSGRSILFTSLTLGGGFAALTLSQFVPVATLGGLMVFTVFVVGAASLTVLPAACLVFLRNPISHLEVSHE